MRPSSTCPAARSTDKTSRCTSWGKPQSRLQHPRAAVNLAALLRRSLGTAAAITTIITTTTTTTTTTTAIGLCQTWTGEVRAGVKARRRHRRRRRGGAGAAHRAAIARRRAGALVTARAHRRPAPAARRRRAATTGGAMSHDVTSHGARALAHLPSLRRPAHPAMPSSCGTLTRIRARTGARAPRRAAVGAARRRQATARLDPKLVSRQVNHIARACHTVRRVVMLPLESRCVRDGVQ